MTTEEKLKQLAVSIVMSDDTTWDVLMGLEIDQELPEGIFAWEPFEHYEVVGLQGLAEEFLFSLEKVAKINEPEPLPK